MPQFLLPPGALREDPERPGRRLFTLTGSEAVHVSRVLRRREGDAIDLFDGHGARYQGTITSVRGDLIEGEIAGTMGTEAPPWRLHLYQGLLKAPRWDWVLEKGTELGVTRFIPVTTSRTVVLLKEPARVRSKIERWRKIVLAAAKQSGCVQIPEIRDPAGFEEALRRAAGEGPVLFAWEKSDPRSTLRRALASLDPRGATALFLGPEGGFSDKEARLAEAGGARLFSLGPRPLRAETAATAACAIVAQELSSL